MSARSSCGGAAPELRTHAARALLLTALLTAGCAAGPSAAAPAATTSAGGSAAAAGQTAGDGPPAAAQMVCSDEIRREVAGALGLESTPTPRSAWADHVYTCTYPLPMGPLTLSVAVAPSNGAARVQFAALRARLEADDAEQGLGEQAYSTPNGALVAVKDDMVLDVDATALPDDLGPGHQRRIEVARLLAAGVFACWTGGS